MLIYIIFYYYDLLKLGLYLFKQKHIMCQARAIIGINSNIKFEIFFKHHNSNIKFEIFFKHHFRRQIFIFTNIFLLFDEELCTQVRIDQRIIFKASSRWQGRSYELYII